MLALAPRQRGGRFLLSPTSLFSGNELTTCMLCYYVYGPIVLSSTLSMVRLCSHQLPSVPGSSSPTRLLQLEAGPGLCFKCMMLPRQSRLRGLTRGCVEYLSEGFGELVTLILGKLVPLFWGNWSRPRCTGRFSYTPGQVASTCPDRRWNCSSRNTPPSPSPFTSPKC